MFSLERELAWNVLLHARENVYGSVKQFRCQRVIRKQEAGIVERGRIFCQNILFAPTCSFLSVRKEMLL